MEELAKWSSDIIPIAFVCVFMCVSVYVCVSMCVCVCVCVCFQPSLAIQKRKDTCPKDGKMSFGSAWLPVMFPGEQLFVC